MKCEGIFNEMQMIGIAYCCTSLILKWSYFHEAEPDDCFSCIWVVIRLLKVLRDGSAGPTVAKFANIKIIKISNTQLYCYIGKLLTMHCTFSLWYIYMYATIATTTTSNPMTTMYIR